MNLGSIFIILWNCTGVIMVLALFYFAGTDWALNIMVLLQLCVFLFFVFKNDVKKSDITWKRIENMEVKYGSVALCWSLFLIFILIIYNFLRGNIAF